MDQNRAPQSDSRDVPEARDVLATLQKLPPLCYATLPSTGEVILIRRGESGYYPVTSHLTPTQLNTCLGTKPTATQVEAMLAGSMFGWEVPGADPDIVAARRRAGR